MFKQCINILTSGHTVLISSIIHRHIPKDIFYYYMSMVFIDNRGSIIYDGVITTKYIIIYKPWYYKMLLSFLILIKKKWP